MKQEEIINMSDLDVKDTLSNLSDKLTKTKLSHNISPIENPLKIRHMRRDIARLKTELRKRTAQ